MFSRCQPQLRARVACNQQICSFWHCDIRWSYCEQHSWFFGEDKELGTKRSFRLELIFFFRNPYYYNFTSCQIPRFNSYHATCSKINTSFSHLCKNLTPLSKFNSKGSIDSN
ncbi:hypothetical protein V8G54_010667 [Vigna mungo]|uniref:Uncharacterized protein n=1 Tax=Vigna mungo TaxID=3915 RepID=A0AAQ3NWZ0_VIGMU